MTTQKIRVTSWTQVTPGTKIYTSKSNREYYICINKNECEWYFNNRKCGHIFLIGEQYLADSEEQYFIEVEEKTEINNRLVQIAEQIVLLQQEQQELEIKLARLEETETVVEVETATIKETTTETVTVDAALQNAYNDYKNKLAKAKEWFDFEPSEYIGNSIHDKIIVWNKEIYYSSHPAFKPGDKFSSHIMNCIAYRKKRTPNQGRSKKFKV
jgi:hypothetical protein